MHLSLCLGGMWMKGLTWESCMGAQMCFMITVDLMRPKLANVHLEPHLEQEHRHVSHAPAVHHWWIPVFVLCHSLSHSIIGSASTEVQYFFWGKATSSSSIRFQEGSSRFVRRHTRAVRQLSLPITLILLGDCVY
jgi:hypothetical protein